MNDPWHHFPNTILDFDTIGSVDLREPVTAATPLPFDRKPFGVVTACNPRGVVVPEEANRNADRTLASRLSALRLPALRTTGRSPDGTHAEPGYAVLAPLETVLDLARDFDQLAIFWWNGDAFSIVPRSDFPLSTR